MKKNFKNKKIIFLSLLILLSTFYFLFSILPVLAQIKFIPQIGIPSNIEAGKEYLVVEGAKVSLLANYVSSFYRWSVTAIAIMAVVVIMVSGIQWILAAGNPPAIQKAREQMMSAIIGLVLILLAIPLFNLINPALVNLRMFEIPNIVPLKTENIEIRELQLSPYNPKIIGQLEFFYKPTEIYQDFIGAIAMKITGEDLKDQIKIIKSRAVLKITTPGGTTKEIVGAFKKDSTTDKGAFVHTDPKFVNPKDPNNIFRQVGEYLAEVNVGEVSDNLEFEIKAGNKPTACEGVDPNQCMYPKTNDPDHQGLYCHPQEPVFLEVIKGWNLVNNDITWNTERANCSLKPALDCNKCPLNQGERYCVFRWLYCEGGRTSASFKCIKEGECVNFRQMPTLVKNILRGRYCKHAGIPGTLARGCDPNIKNCSCGDDWVCCKIDIVGNSISPCACVAASDCATICGQP